MSKLIIVELRSEEDEQCNNCLNYTINKLEKEEIRLKTISLWITLSSINYCVILNIIYNHKIFLWINIPTQNKF